MNETVIHLRRDALGKPIRSVHGPERLHEALALFPAHWPELSWSMAVHGPYALWCCAVEGREMHVACFANMTLAGALSHASEWGEVPVDPPVDARVLVFLAPTLTLARSPSVRRVHLWLTKAHVEAVALSYSNLY